MKNLKLFCLSLGMSLVGLASCQDEALVVNNTRSDASVEEWDGVVYPSSKNYMPMTRGLLSQFETDWENCTIIPTPTDPIGIDAPWAESGVDANLPYYFACDVKKEDGWKMLFHTFHSTDEKNRYIGLYNMRTGFLKVFYYLKDEAFLNNSGVWELEFSEARPFLNHTAELAIPISLESVEEWKCSNAVSLSNKPFMLGWNGFQVQLAYWPNVSEDYALDILGKCLNIGDENLFGDTYSHSEGTILTYKTTNPLSGLTSDFASVFGNEAGEFIGDLLDDGDAKEQTQDTESRGLLDGLANSIVKFGLNNIFSKLTASFSQPSITRSDLEFSSKGIVSLNGDFSLSTNAPVKSGRFSFNKDNIGELGVWNLTEQPTIYVDPRADFVPNPPYDEMYHEYNYQLRGVSRYEYDLLINPELEPYIKDQWVEIDLIRYWDYEHCADVPEVPEMYSFGSLGSRSRGFDGDTYKEEDLIYGEHLVTGAIYREPMAYTIYTKYQVEPDGEYRDPEPTVYVPNTETYTEKRFNSENIFMKVSLYLVTEFEGKEETTISTRTFIPKIEWDPVICEQMEKMEQLKKQEQLEEEGMSEEELEGDAPEEESEEEVAEEELPLDDDLD